MDATNFTESLLAGSDLTTLISKLEATSDPTGVNSILEQAAELVRIQGHAELAIRVWALVRLRDPSSVNAAANLSRLLLVNQRLQEALPNIEAWTRLDPRSKVAWALLGGSLAASGDLEGAIVAFESALRVTPDDADLLSEKALVLTKMDRLVDAADAYEAVLVLDPQRIAVLNDLGVLRLHLKQYAVARNLFERALAIAPDNARVALNLSVALRLLDCRREALELARTAVSLAPTSPPAITNLASALIDQGDYQDALAFLDGFAGGSAGEFATPRAQALRGLGRHAEAESVLADALKSESVNDKMWFAFGTIRMEMGRTSEAELAFDRAISLAPTVGAYHRGKSDVHTYRQGDDHFFQMLRLEMQGGISSDDALQLNFALGKALDDMKMYEQAIIQFHKGNRAKRNLNAYNESNVAQLATRVLDCFPIPIVRETSSPDVLSRRPVFIVGMPRSGTTLVEQILTSHPSAQGIGERSDFQTALDRWVLDLPIEHDSQLTIEDFVRVGRDYLSSTAPADEAVLRILDKLPSNFFFLGFIAKALPNAQIIHVRRDPVDTCISLYSKLFAETQDFSYDLGELGRYYRLYEKIMEHWRRVLPSGIMFEIDYEAIVAEPEIRSRELVSFLGLTWDEACLQFYKTERVVTTASATQVRKPIYSTSVGRREGYLPFLGPLVKALEADK